MAIGVVVFSLFRRDRAPPVQITAEGVQVAQGRRSLQIPFTSITLIYTSLRPEEDFQEVLALEFSGEVGAGLIVLDPREGCDLEAAVSALREGLGERWPEVYIGHKHLSRVRGGP